jgi:hypothetical protein
MAGDPLILDSRPFISTIFQENKITHLYNAAYNMAAPCLSDISVQGLSASF